jgi:hypothetical protein
MDQPLIYDTKDQTNKQNVANILEECFLILSCNQEYVSSFNVTNLKTKQCFRLTECQLHRSHLHFMDSPFIQAYGSYHGVYPCLKCVLSTNERRHNKTNIVGLRPAWIQTSLRIRAVWSGSMLFAYQPYNK